MKPIDDHVMMITPNGAKKAIPLHQVDFWIQNGIFDKVGYRFVDEEYATEVLAKWKAVKAAAEARKKMAPPVIMRDGGPAEAHTKIQPSQGGAPVTGHQPPDASLAGPGGEPTREDGMVDLDAIPSVNVTDALAGGEGVPKPPPSPPAE